LLHFMLDILLLCRLAYAFIHLQPYIFVHLNSNSRVFPPLSTECVGKVHCQGSVGEFCDDSGPDLLLEFKMKVKGNVDLREEVRLDELEVVLDGCDLKTSGDAEHD